MNWNRKRSISKLVSEILNINYNNRPPIELINDIMKERGIIFEERDENDEEFCGVYIVKGRAKIIFVNSNLYKPRKNFTIAHELGHHYLGHTLTDGAIICDKNALNAKNKNRPEIEKEADYFATCLLMPEKLINQKKLEFENEYCQQISVFADKINKAKQIELANYLCNFFQVSKEAMGYRLEELKIT